jgi:hypothetical protein
LVHILGYPYPIQLFIVIITVKAQKTARGDNKTRLIEVCFYLIKGGDNLDDDKEGWLP